MTSSEDRIRAQCELFYRGIDADRLAHAYILVGSPRGLASTFAEKILQYLSCEGLTKPCGTCRACRAVSEHTHPDFHWLEPQKKSRIISVAQIRELIKKLSESSFEGGWKAGVIVAADRMNEEAQNAFLKTLEEPSPRSLMLLLTDAPQVLLATINSRCHRILLSLEETLVEQPWTPALLNLLKMDVPRDAVTRQVMVKAFEQIIEDERKRIEGGMKEEKEASTMDESSDVWQARVESRLREARAEMLRAMLLWQRDVLLLALGQQNGLLHFPADVEVLQKQAEEAGYRGARGRIQAVEGILTRLNRNFRPGAAFEAGLAEMARA